MRDEKIREAVRAIAAHLDEWVVAMHAPRDEAVYMIGPGQARVLVSWAQGAPGRLEFLVSPGRELRPFEGFTRVRPKGTVDARREPASAARDIARRVLEPSVPYVESLRVRKAARDKKREAQWASLGWLEAHLGGATRQHHNRPEDPMQAEVWRGETSEPRVEATLTTGRILEMEPYKVGPDRINVKIQNLDPETAADLLAWVRRRLWED